MGPTRRFTSLALLSLLVSSAFADHNHRPPRIYDLKNVEWHLSFDETLGTIKGDVTNTLSPLKPNTMQVWFDSAKLSIAKVTVNGKPAKFKVAPERLFVALPKPSGPKDNLAIRILYTGRPEAGIYFIPAARAFPAHTSVVYTQGEMEDTHYYIPTYDYPDDKATSESFIKAPSNYVVVSNGKLIDVKPMGAMKVVHHRMDVPHSTYLMSLIAGRYDVGNDGTYEGKPVRWNVPEGLAPMGKAAFGGTDKMIAVYSDVTGVKYPYAKFDQSAVPDYMFGGMENITAVTQSIDALLPPEAAPVDDAEGLVLHELAHQWFGDLVTGAGWPHIWINEGWATFLPSFYIRHAHGQEAYDLSRYETLQGGYWSAMGENRPVVLTKYEEPIDVFGGTIYPGGASRMFVLMHMLGEEKFWKATTNYLNQYKFKAVTTEQFFDSYSKFTGVDLDTFRREWFYRKEVPHLTVKRDGQDLVIQQRKPAFTLDVDVWVLNGTEWVKKSVHTATEEVRMPLGDLAGKPLLVDPEVFLMGSVEYKDKLSADDFMALYRNAPNAAAKARLDDDHISVLSGEQVKRLADEEKNVDLRIRLLGHVQDEAYLLNLARTDGAQDPRLLNALTSVPPDRKISDEAVAWLRETFEQNQNPVIRQNALHSILAREKDDALAERAWQMPSYNDQFRIIALDYFARTAPDRAREMALGVMAHPDSEKLRVHAIGMLGRLKDKPGDRRVFNALVKVVQERSFNARRDAINALAAYGDKAAVPFIEPVTTHSLHFMRRTAQAAVARLKGK